MSRCEETIQHRVCRGRNVGIGKVVGTVGSMETMECQGVTEPFNVGFREDVTPGSARVVGTVGPKPGRSFRNESKVKVILVRSVGTM
jgi:hypothetical protein